LKCHLEDEVGNEGGGLELGHVVSVLGQHGKHRQQVFQTPQQHRGVRVEKAQRQPLEDQVQVVHRRLRVRVQELDKY